MWCLLSKWSEFVVFQLLMRSSSGWDSGTCGLMRKDKGLVNNQGSRTNKKGNLSHCHLRSQLAYREQRGWTMNDHGTVETDGAYITVGQRAISFLITATIVIYIYERMWARYPGVFFRRQQVSIEGKGCKREIRLLTWKGQTQWTYVNGTHLKKNHN